MLSIECPAKTGRIARICLGWSWFSLDFYVIRYFISHLILATLQTETDSFAIIVDYDEKNHKEPSHVDLHCLHFGVWILPQHYFHFVFDLFYNRPYGINGPG